MEVNQKYLKDGNGEVFSPVTSVDSIYNDGSTSLGNIFKGIGHNAFYRGEDITDLWYDGTLSEQIAAQTFDDIFIGDYIIGQVSGRRYLVAHINYYLDTGYDMTTTPHILMIPELSMGTAEMNSTATTTGAYTGSEMYTTNLEEFKTIIRNDFETTHILSYSNYLANAVTDNYESSRNWYNSDIDLMSEMMVYGTEIYHNTRNGTSVSNNTTLDTSQLSLFRLNKSKMVLFDEYGNPGYWWLRDVYSSTAFCSVTYTGGASYNNASLYRGVRPTFLIY